MTTTLRTALERAKENLGLCHERHSGEYIGGMEYTALMGLIDEALASTPQAGEAVHVPEGWQLVPKGAVRCLVTTNPFGTDTWKVDAACGCKVCQAMLAAAPQWRMLNETSSCLWWCGIHWASFGQAIEE